MTTEIRADSAGMPADTEVRRMTAAELRACTGEFAELLVDTVRGGNSLGFLDPLGHDTAAAWWRDRAAEVAAGGLVVLAARAGGRILGTVSLALTDKPNGRHRAEVVKLMVHSAARGLGLGRALLVEAERTAAAAGVRLLVLDTETGSRAEGFYRNLGWTEVGTIPDFATDPYGVPHPTTVFYKQLGRG